MVSVATGDTAAEETAEDDDDEEADEDDEEELVPVLAENDLGVDSIEVSPLDGASAPPNSP